MGVNRWPKTFALGGTYVSILVCSRPQCAGVVSISTVVRRFEDSPSLGPRTSLPLSGEVVESPPESAESGKGLDGSTQ